MINDTPSETSARHRFKMPARSGWRRSTNRCPPRFKCQPSTGNLASEALAATKADNRKGMTPEFLVASALKAEEEQADGWRKLGFTAHLIAPDGGVVVGQSALAVMQRRVNDAAAGAKQLGPQRFDERRFAAAVRSDDCSAPVKLSKPHDEPFDIHRGRKQKWHCARTDEARREGVGRRRNNRRHGNTAWA